MIASASSDAIAENQEEGEILNAEGRETDESRNQETENKPSSAEEDKGKEGGRSFGVGETIEFDL